MIYLIVSIFCAKKEVIIMKHNETHLELFSQLETLVIFRDLLQDPVIGKLKALVTADCLFNSYAFNKDTQISVDPGPFSSFAAELFKQSSSSVSYTHLTLPTNREV